MKIRQKTNSLNFIPNLHRIKYKASRLLEQLLLSEVKLNIFELLNAVYVFQLSTFMEDHVMFVLQTMDIREMK